MPNILLISPTAASGGAERAIAALARHLPGFGYLSHVVLLENGPLEHWLAQGDCSVEVLPMRRTRYLHETASLLSHLRSRCRQVSAVIANHSKGQVIAGLAAATVHTPCIWWQHSSPRRSRIELMAAAIPAAAVICSGSEAARRQRRLTPHRRVETIYPGSDIEDIRRRSGGGSDWLRSEHGLDGPIVGVVARLQPGKGHELFLRAAALVARERPDVRFVVIGGTTMAWHADYETHLRTIATDLNIGHRVLFVGHQNDVYPWFGAMDVAVTASIDDSFGLVTVEALAAGTPLVGVRSGGTIDIIEDKVSGLLVPPGSPTFMAAAILNLLTDSTLRERIREGGADRAKAFSDVTMTSKFAQLLGEILVPQQR